MSQPNAFAIEIEGRTAGIVVAERGGYTFFASDWTFRDLDRRVFRYVDQAERAVQQVLTPKPARRH
jgi:hypothetical protein